MLLPSLPSLTSLHVLLPLSLTPLHVLLPLLPRQLSLGEKLSRLCGTEIEEHILRVRRAIELRELRLRRADQTRPACCSASAAQSVAHIP